MNWLLYIILGGFAGWLAGRIFKGEGFGFFMNLIVGIIGGIIGGWLFNFLGVNIGDGIIGSLITAVIGGGILVFIVGLVKKKK
ncbi:MAG: GlsB/YeaQ/YmgE family stress response membrane protein [Bacteroidales bacterium]|nr:GlsB/YeaQ/YmgE family stress response membrane protein [Bacteroidales bacterium]